MTASEVHPASQSGRRTMPAAVGLAVLGALVGVVGSYVTAVAGSVQSPGSPGVKPMTLLLLAVVAAAAVVIGWRWRIVGIVAGIVMLALVAFAFIDQLAWSSAPGAWSNPANAIAYGAASGYPTLIGAAMLTSALLHRRTRTGD
ncbi:hypothetical protein Q7F20_03595 [Curtobacterium sp. A7_M15]|uniref:hypothetical protein n=1 Tax=Curtobacterium sp. A7_M15 TaxID=3065241 RepID=UPI002737CA03|nr:hypothetical protein [Curtobacterium sp. A7_M15]MDP4332440.1 hypothetical protein [Curtobacterium sp. A7_M15]